MNCYNVLSKQIFSSGSFSLVPIRFEDRFDIMKWRNEQIYHLRQDKPLTTEYQESYFNNVVAKLFEQEQPDQILFSYLQNDKCIGYGGLVHIDWINRNTEVSFLMNTDLEKEYFEKHWRIFLKLIEKVAFGELDFHKIYIYSFYLRPHLYDILKSCGYIEDARLKEHCLFDNRFIDVLIHSKFSINEN
jgi:RimJ/RimL family protein N-acetyltransferase